MLSRLTGWKRIVECEPKDGHLRSSILARTTAILPTMRHEHLGPFRLTLLKPLDPVLDVRRDRTLPEIGRWYMVAVREVRTYCRAR